MYKISFIVLCILALRSNAQSNKTDTSIKGLYDIETMPYSPFDDYSDTYNQGVASFNSKNWETAFQLFLHAHKVLESLINANRLNPRIDTNLLFLAGSAALNNGREDDAIEWFSKLATKKIGGLHRELTYKTLIAYYLDKRDDEHFYNYLKTAISLYPNEKYFKLVEFDFIRKQHDIQKLVHFYDKKISKSSGDYTLYFDKALEIFNYLHPLDSSKIPTQNTGSLESEMIESLKKAAKINSQIADNFLMLGDCYKIKAIAIGKEILLRKDFVNTHAVTPEATGNLKTSYRQNLDSAINAYKAAAAILEKKEMNDKEKIMYRASAQSLYEIFQAKKLSFKINTKERGSYEEQAQQWKYVFDRIH